MKNIFICFLLISFFYSCQEVIELDLNSSDPQIVIEAIINDSGDSALVKITKSVNFNTDNIFPAVEGATVVISDNLGNTDTLIETEVGNYKAAIVGIPGNTYYLNVISGSETYTSSSELNIHVNFDSLVINEVQSNGRPRGGSSIRHEVFVYFKDPAYKKNYYRFVEYKNGKASNRLFIYDDRLSNGSDVSLRLRGNTSKYESGDVITIEMQCIDKNVFDYFNSFTNLNGGPMSASAPANPYSNIQNARLGYFSAYSSQKRTIIIP